MDEDKSFIDRSISTYFRLFTFISGSFLYPGKFLVAKWCSNFVHGLLARRKGTDPQGSPHQCAHEPDPQQGHRSGIDPSKPVTECGPQWLPTTLQARTRQT